MATLADVKHRSPPATIGLPHCHWFVGQSVNKLLTTASAVFRYAAHHELTDRNPAALVERYKRNAGEVEIGAEKGAETDTGVNSDKVLSPGEAARLIAEAEPGYYRTYFLTAVLSGARVGELTALRWNDVDLDADTMGIRRTASWAKLRGTPGVAKPRFFPPKTKESRRTIPMPPELVSALRRWKLACPPSALNLMFPNAEGTPRHRSTIACDGLGPALKRAGLQHVTIHSLRHTFASALIMQARPVTEVSHLLGHKSPAITLSVYSHWFKGVHTGAVDDLAKVVCAPQTKTR